MKITVKDLGSGESKEIPDTELGNTLAQGDYAIPNTEYDVIAPDGTEGTVPASSLKEAITKGYKYKDSAFKKEQENQKKYGDNELEAAGYGAASALTFGTSNYLIPALTGISKERIKEVSNRSPIAHGIGEYGTTALAILASGGAAAPLVAESQAVKTSSSIAAKILKNSAPALLNEASEKIGSKIVAGMSDGILKSAAKTGLAGSIEGPLYAAGNLVSESVLGDADLNAENLLMEAGKGFAIGGLTGGILGGSFKAAEKGVKIAKDKMGQELSKAAEKGDIGILKWAGAQKKHFKELLNKNSLDEKDLVDYTLDLTKGFDDTVESIVANNGITKAGGKDLLKTITTSIDNVVENNLVVKDASIKMMDEPVIQANSSFLSRFEKGELPENKLVFGDSLADVVEKEFIEPSKGIYDPRVAPLNEMVEKLRGLGVLKDQSGNVIARVPLTPAQLREQSIVFGQLAKFEKMNPTGKEEAYRTLRTKLEDSVTESLKQSDPSGELLKKYLNGKKLYQKSATLDGMLQNRMATEAANNRGFSLTEGLAAATGAAAAGPMGAIAGYAARKLQREYGDIATSAVLRKIEQKINSSGSNLRISVNNFFSKTREGVRSVILSSEDPSPESYARSKKELERFQIDPESIIDDFITNNQTLLEHAPNTAAAAQARVVAGVNFLQSKFPQAQGNYLNLDYEPSRSEVMMFNNYVEAISRPKIIFDQLKEGYVNPHTLEAIKTVYPKIFSNIQEELLTKMPKNLTRYQRIQLQPILGSRITPAMDYQNLMRLQNKTQNSAQAEAQAQAEMNRVPVSAARNIKASERTQTGLDKALFRT